MTNKMKYKIWETKINDVMYHILAIATATSTTTVVTSRSGIILFILCIHVLQKLVTLIYENYP